MLHLAYRCSLENPAYSLLKPTHGVGVSMTSDTLCPWTSGIRWRGSLRGPQEKPTGLAIVACSGILFVRTPLVRLRRVMGQVLVRQGTMGGEFTEWIWGAGGWGAGETLRSRHEAQVPLLACRTLLSRWSESACRRASAVETPRGTRASA